MFLDEEFLAAFDAGEISTITFLRQDMDTIVDQATADIAELRERAVMDPRVTGLSRDHHQLMVANLPLVFFFAQIFNTPPLTFPEKVEAGLNGLIKGVKRWDPKRGYTLSTYVQWWIREQLTEAQADALGIPRQALGRVIEFRQTANRLMMEKGVSQVSVEEVLDAMGIKRRDGRKNVLNALRLISPLELDAPKDKVGDDGDEYLPWGRGPTQVIPPDEQAERNVIKEILERILFNDSSGLTAREEMVIARRYGLNGWYPISRVELAKKMGVDSERVRQIEVKACAKLRQNPKLQKLFADICVTDF